MRPYAWAFLASAVTSALAAEPHWTDVMHMSNADAASGIRQESVIKFDENSFQRKGDLTLEQLGWLLRTVDGSSSDGLSRVV